MAATDRRALLRDTYAPGLRRSAVVAGTAWHAFLLVPLLLNLGAYRNPAPPVLAWCLMAAAGAVLMPRVWRRPLTGGESRLACCLPTVATLLVAPMCRNLDTVGFADWPANGTTWLLVLVAASRRSREWTLAVAGPIAVQAVCGVAAAGAGDGLTVFERVSSTSYGAVVVLLMISGIRPAFEVHADVVSREATLRGRAAAEQRSAEAVRNDRRTRLALLQRDVLPLLNGVAEGTADPTDPEVRGRCAAQSTALRRALVDSVTVQVPLVSELRSVADAAARTGVTVNLQVLAAAVGGGAAVRAATRQALAAVLAELSPQDTVLTVMAGDAGVEVYLALRIDPSRQATLQELVSSFGGPDGWHASLTVDDAPDPSGGVSGYLNVRWPREGT